MKKLFLILFITLSAAEASFSQVKRTKATQQKIFAGIGGVFMNYLIEFKNPTGVMIEVDSIKSIADSSEVKFSFTRFAPCCKNQIAFVYALSKPEKCKTCPDVTPKQSNLTKGVIIYYSKGEKKFVLKVKKFKLLPDLRTP